jgi:hypothetical protein
VEIMTRSWKHEIIKYLMAGMLGQFFYKKILVLHRRVALHSKGKQKAAARNQIYLTTLAKTEGSEKHPIWRSKLFLLAELLINWNTTADLT